MYCAPRERRVGVENGRFIISEVAAFYSAVLVFTVFCICEKQPQKVCSWGEGEYVRGCVS